MSKTTKAELRERLVNAAARNRRLVAANERLLTEAREARRAAEAAEAARQEALGVAPLLASVAQEALQAAEAAREERDALQHRLDVAPSGDGVRTLAWQRRRAEEAEQALGQMRHRAAEAEVQLEQARHRAAEAEQAHSRVAERLSRAVGLLREVVDSRNDLLREFS